MSHKWVHKSNTKTYNAWGDMRRRCLSPSHPSYPHYGGRGITVCAAWQNNYDAFFTDMGECPPRLTLERIDNERGYFPDNCTWATQKQQCRNHRRNRRISFAGKTQLLSDWAVELKLDPGTLSNRLRKHPPEIALAVGRLVLPRTQTSPLVHGTNSGYNHHKCRCRECKAAHAAVARSYRGK